MTQDRRHRHRQQAAHRHRLATTLARRGFHLIRTAAGPLAIVPTREVRR